MTNEERVLLFKAAKGVCELARLMEAQQLGAPVDWSSVRDQLSDKIGPLLDMLANYTSEPSPPVMVRLKVSE